MAHPGDRCDRLRLGDASGGSIWGRKKGAPALFDDPPRHPERRIQRTERQGFSRRGHRLSSLYHTAETDQDRLTSRYCDPVFSSGRKYSTGVRGCETPAPSQAQIATGGASTP